MTLRSPSLKTLRLCESLTAVGGQLGWVLHPQAGKLGGLWALELVEAGAACPVHRAQAGHLMAFPGSASAVLSLVRRSSVCGEGGSLRAGLPVRGFWAGPVWLLDLILLQPGLSLL